MTPTVLSETKTLIKTLQIVLSGGVFQNGLLLCLTEAKLRIANYQVYSHHQVPPNDGGLSLGQAMIAACKLNQI